MRRSYAVVWSRNGDLRSGRLDTFDDRFELRGRSGGAVVPFASLRRAAILRSTRDRLRGLPVLRLELTGEEPVRIASLEGAAVLHELADRVERAGLSVSA